MTTILRLLHRAWRSLSGLVHRTVHAIAHLAASTGTRTIAFTRTARERLTSRWHSDGTYRRTLIAALSAISATLLPHPAAAAALGALLAERPVRSTPRRDPFLDDYDEGDYPPRRSPLDPWAPSPRPLWDTLE